MMMKITATLLILSSALCAKAIPGIFHKHTQVSCCSDPDENIDKEGMFGLDGEVMWYADFKKGKGEEPVPPFVDPITWDYPLAVGQQEICKHNLKMIRSAMKNPPLTQEAPHGNLYTKHEVELGVDNVLICRVTGFYPAPIHITWTRNNLNLTTNITSSVPYRKEDKTFYQFSSLKFTPEQGDIYSCRVNHTSLTKPDTMMWDVDHHIPAPPSMGPAVFCGVGLTLGLLGVAMGTFFLIKGNQCN